MTFVDSGTTFVDLGPGADASSMGTRALVLALMDPSEGVESLAMGNGLPSSASMYPSPRVGGLGTGIKLGLDVPKCGHWGPGMGIEGLGSTSMDLDASTKDLGLALMDSGAGVGNPNIGAGVLGMGTGVTCLASMDPGLGVEHLVWTPRI